MAKSAEEVAADLLMAILTAITPIAVLFYVSEKAWEFFKEHYIPICSIVGGVITLLVTLNLVVKHCPRFWKALKIGCVTIFVLLVIMIIVYYTYCT